MNEENVKVTVGLSSTIPTVRFGNLKPEIRIENIDITKDVQEQVDAAIKAAAIVWTAIDDNIMQFVDEAAKAVGGGLETDDRVAKLEEQTKWLKKAVDTLKKSE